MVYRLWNVCCFKWCLPEVEFVYSLRQSAPHSWCVITGDRPYCARSHGDRKVRAGLVTVRTGLCPSFMWPYLQCPPCKKSCGASVSPSVRKMMQFAIYLEVCWWQMQPKNLRNVWVVSTSLFTFSFLCSVQPPQTHGDNPWTSYHQVQVKGLKLDLNALFFLLDLSIPFSEWHSYIWLVLLIFSLM